MAIAPQRYFHVNVNCSDLERSLAFYRDLIGLTPTVRTTPQPQPGAAFGLATAQWDAWILAGHGDGLVLDLLQWLEPAPTGVPATAANQLGFNRLAIATPELDAAFARLRAAGATVWSDPVPLGPGSDRRYVICLDPDGTQIELVDGDRLRLSHLAINVADLAATEHHLVDVLGMTPTRTFDTGPIPGTPFGMPGTVALQGALYADVTTGFQIEAISWLDPAPVGHGARAANELGIFRVAMLTDDIARDHAGLVAAGVECYSPPAHLSMGPGLPDLQALFWGDPDGACFELIESPASS
jgi:catechol 2,3-dioxygenase-like lactoylglutathione lyase family enzyme